jgi:hypothetical protein
MKDKNSLIITVLVAILFAIGGFFAGQKYQQRRTVGMARQIGNVAGARYTGQPQRGNGFRPVAGEIIASDEKSITVKLVDGGSKIVLLSEKTEINKASSANKEELKVGEKVSIFGTENSDGSVTATNIQIGAMVRGIINK